MKIIIDLNDRQIGDLLKKANTESQKQNDGFIAFANKMHCNPVGLPDFTIIDIIHRAITEYCDKL